MNISQNIYNSLIFLEKEKIFLEKNNLIKITKNHNFLIDKIPYASTQNFCNEKLYSHNFIYLHKDAFLLLKKAQIEAKKLNYQIRIFDCFRPFKIQAYMAYKFPEFEKAGYISHPKDGIATHVRGIAVDLTLTDANCNDLDMGTIFDDMSINSHHNCQTINLTAQNNRQILKNIMENAGFESYSFEWWHYNLKIFEYKNHEIIGANQEADTQYPKILENFDELIFENIKSYEL
jgi:D-alanyl-D-alanine dipeptidase